MVTVLGTVYVCSWASSELLRSLTVSEGLGTFWQFNRARTKRTLMQSVQSTGSEVLLAHTGANLLVGYLIVSRASRYGRWGASPFVYELTLEVNRSWRKLGIATRLLHQVVSDSHWEDKVLLARGYSWTWDLEGAGLTTEEYRDMWYGMLQKLGFIECPTDDPSFLGDPYSLLMAWIGPQVREEARERFWSNLVQAQ